MKFVSFDIVFQEVPNEVSLAINISGCPNRCPGCHSQHLTEDCGEELNLESLDALLQRYASSITCVCFMGGDADKGFVERMCQYVHTQWHKCTAWYSGQSQLPTDAEAVDYVKLGAYDAHLGALKSRSTNQRMYHLVNGSYEDITSSFWR